MTNMHLITKEKKEIIIEDVQDVEWHENHVSIRYLEDGVINIRVFDFETFDIFSFKEVE